MLMLLMAGLISTPGQLQNLPFDSQFQYESKNVQIINEPEEIKINDFGHHNEEPFGMFIVINILNQMMHGNLDLNDEISIYIKTELVKVDQMKIYQVLNRVTGETETSFKDKKEGVIVLLHILAKCTNQPIEELQQSLKEKMNGFCYQPSI